MSHIKDTYTIQSEIDAIEYIIQVRKYADGFFDVGYLFECGRFEIKHPALNSEEVINILSLYCNSLYFKLNKK
jgi:hypothetical protein